MLETTTIKIYKKHLRWWNLCCKVKNKNSQECFAEFRESVKLKKQEEIYKSLPMPNDYKRPLENVKLLNKNKIEKKYIKISGIL
jgi:hypothetical protein